MFDIDGVKDIANREVGNIARASVYSDMAGRSQSDPLDLLSEYLDEGVALDQKTYDDWFNKYVFDVDTGECLYSDYAIIPLQKAAFQIMISRSPEEMFININKALDVVHHNGDIAAWFIKGGCDTLSKLSNGEVF